MITPAFDLYRRLPGPADENQPFDLDPAAGWTGAAAPYMTKAFQSAIRRYERHRATLRRFRHRSAGRIAAKSHRAVFVRDCRASAGCKLANPRLSLNQ